MTTRAERLARPDLERLRLPIVLAVTAAVGIGFNVIRAGLLLDRADVGTAIAAFAILGAFTALLAWGSRLRAPELGLLKPPLVAAVAGTLLVSVSLVGPSLLLHPHPVLALSPGMVLPLVALYLGFVAPAEELLFRGVLFAGLRRFAGPAAAIGISAAIFALAHWPVYGPSVIPLDFAAGLLLGWLRWWSRSLGPPIAVHAIADLALLVI